MTNEADDARATSPVLELVFYPTRGEPIPLLELRAGAAVAIVGDASAGRDALLRALAGLEPPYARPEGDERVPGEARVLLDGRLKRRRDRWRSVGVVFEQGGLWTGRSVRFNLELPYRYHGRHAPAGWRDRLEELARELDLHDALARRVEDTDLSIRRRAALARELAKEPRVLLFDEPQLGLSDAERERVLELLERRRSTRGVAVVFGDPDGYLRPFKVDRVLELADGQLRRVAAPSARPRRIASVDAPLERRAR
ncbi:MAG: ATP-binding cassette domain-containing protein [Myxococcales bacterium]|nr:ATP-binding cassette domain-containing protein [Myxococcales bacterium]